MSDQRDGGISWTDHTWNPIRGCSRVSPGCENCYAEAAAGRFCWIRSIVDQCRAAGVPAFVKQLGALPTAWNGEVARHMLSDRKGADQSEWPEDLRVREFPGARS